MANARQKQEAMYERGMIIEVGGMFFVIQTECCNYTLYNHYTFGKIHVGGSNPVFVDGSKMSIKVGDKSAKVTIVKSSMREGYDSSMVVVVDPAGETHRAFNIDGMPSGWKLVVLDSERNVFYCDCKTPPSGYSVVHGTPGVPLPAITRFR